MPSPATQSSPIDPSSDASATAPAVFTPIPQHLNTPTPRANRSRDSPTQSSSQNPSPGSPRHQSGTVDTESILRANGGDTRRALDALVVDRNSLESQNSKLWKLIEKQRAHCTQLAMDNDRLRIERERANKRLVAAGIEPIGASPNSRGTHGSSAVGLAIRGTEIPVTVRRHNSDQDDPVPAVINAINSSSSSSVPSPEPPTKSPANLSSTAPTSTTFAPIPTSLSPAITPFPMSSDSIAPSHIGLLPSPMPDRERMLRHESRMTFPPEVASFMALAESPAVPTLGTRSVHPTDGYGPSGSSSLSASPSGVSISTSSGTDYGSGGGCASSLYTRSQSAEIHNAPPSLKTSIEELDETISPQPNLDTAMSLLSTAAEPSEILDVRDGRENNREAWPSASSASLFVTPGSSILHGSSTTTLVGQSSSVNVDSNKPFQLSQAFLPYTRLSISHSTIFPNQNGRDVLCFNVEVSVRHPNSTQPRTWSIAKLFSSFVDLDARTQARSGKSRKDWKRIVAPLPDGKAWKDFAPSKIDQRKAALQAYLESLLVAPLNDKSDLCHFLSTDLVQKRDNENRKEGYLTKKGKTLGGWKSRYFVLEGSVMKYYESRGGALLGQIQINGAQIGRQNKSLEAGDDRNFRHAFLIIEIGKRDTQNRHVLCAGSDTERDSWIDALVPQVEPESSSPIPYAVPNPPMPLPLPSTPPAIQQPQHQPQPQQQQQQQQKSQQPQQQQQLQRKRSAIRKSSKDVVVTSAKPMSFLPDANAKFISGAPSPSVINSMESQRQLHGSTHPSQVIGISTTTNSAPGGHPLNLVASPSDSEYPVATIGVGESAPAKFTKRQSAAPVRQSFSPAYLTKLSNDGLSAPPGYNFDRDRKAKSGRFWGFGKTSDRGAQRPVFGVPLTDSLAIATLAGLPAIVFRCIEYLEAKNAEQEEGLYRLSGSSAVIKGLKDRFDNEGDVNLLAIDERWDPHAIAGLLKTFLRELPTSLLTRELHMRFLAVIDLIDSAARVTELSRLVAELPPDNYALLRALTAHLILIVRNSASNKMTLRNIGIVFSPTLGIPAGIFYELVSRFGAIFDDDADADALALDDVGIPDAIASVGVTEASSAAVTINGANETNEAALNTAPADPNSHKRNSILYLAGGTDAMLGLAGRALDPNAEDSTSEMSLSTDPESENPSAHSSNLSFAPGAEPRRVAQVFSAT